MGRLGQRLPDTAQGDGTTVVEPGSADDPFSKGSTENQPAASSEGGTAPADKVGPAGEGDTNAPASAPTEPASTPASAQPTATQPQPSPPAPAATPAASDEPPAPGATPAEPAQATTGDEGDADTTLLGAVSAVPITQAQFDEFKTEQEKQYTDQLRTQQAGQDRAMAVQKKEMDAIREESQQALEELRTVRLEGLSEEDQTKLRQNWDHDDKVKQVDEYRVQVEGYHSDVDIVRLLNEYAQYGVTEDELKEMEMEARELFCVNRRATHWEDIASGKKPSENGQPKQPTDTQPPAEPPAPVPAGASAPSDAGGGGSPAPTTTFNQEQGPDAMIENIGQGWETPARRG